MIKIGDYQQPERAMGVKQSQKSSGCFKVITDKVKNFFADGFRLIGDINQRSGKLGKFCKFTARLLTGVAHSTGSAFRAAGLLNAINLTDNVIDCVGTAVDLNDTLDLKEGPNLPKLDKVAHKINLVAMITLVIADVGGFILWLDQLALISLATISTAIGNGFTKLAGMLGQNFAKFTASVAKQCPFIANVASRISVLTVVRSLAALGFALLAAKTCFDLAKAIKAHDLHAAINQSIYLISYTAESVLKIVLLVGFMSVPGIVAIGCVAAGLGLVAFGYEMFRKYKEERDRELQRT